MVVYSNLSAHGHVMSAPARMRCAMVASQSVLNPPRLSELGFVGNFLGDYSTMLRAGKALCRNELRAPVRFQDVYRNVRHLSSGRRDYLESSLDYFLSELRAVAGVCLPASSYRIQEVPLGPMSTLHYAIRSLSRGNTGALLVDFQSLKSRTGSKRIGTVAFCSCSVAAPVASGRIKEIGTIGAKRLRTLLVETSQIKRKAVVDQASTETNLSDFLKQGALMEIDREPGRILLAVVQRRDGKKNWIVEDQFGNTFSVRPQQVTYVVPGVENFEPSRICHFIDEVEGLQDNCYEGLQDFTLLEMAWEEILELDVCISVADLAKILYVQANPVECYAAHRMLSSAQLYFRCKQKGHLSIYEPRTSSEVHELQEQRLAEEASKHEFLTYVTSIKTVLEQPQDQKTPPPIWSINQRFRSYTLALELFALERTNITNSQKKMAEEVLEAVEMPRSSTAAVDLLVGMGIVSPHVNLELLKGNTRVKFSEKLVAAAHAIADDTPDPDMASRVDLRHLKVYTIDSEDTVEIDDGLSAMRLPYGSFKVWIHVADPTRWVAHDHPLTQEARYRSTSIYLPTETIPMFPMYLAAGCFSLVQGRECCALTFSIVLRSDGSVAEYDVMNSIICPTYKMSYDHVTELLSLSVEEENELYLLAEAATARSRWRKLHGSVDVDMPDVVVKVTGADKPEPVIHISPLDHSLPANQLVTEMMVLCGEVASAFGDKRGLPLPYRGQTARDIPKDEIEGVPEGPCRAMALIRFLGRAEVNYAKRLPHAALGVPGYVQVTSPIRRYGDLVAHYQIKAALREDCPPPFKGAQIEASMVMSSITIKEAKRLQSAARRYWTLEYLRRLPRQTQHEALVLRVARDNDPLVLLPKVGIQCHMPVFGSTAVGQRFFVLIDRADPRRDILEIRKAS